MSDTLTEVFFSPGSHIREAAKQLVEAARDGGAFGHFNDIKLNATPATTAASVIEFFNDETARLHEEYKKSSAGKAVAAERDQRRSAAQAVHDRLMVDLRSLDFSDDVAVLDWLCAMQGPSDHVGVILRRATIVSAFEKRGFVESANCGAAYKAGDRDNMFRYLVGQALNGLKSGPGIHSILLQFADEWRTEFGVTALSQPGSAQ